MNRASSHNDQSLDDSVVAEYDPVIQRLLPRFVANRHQDVGTILYALERNDYDRLEEMGHNLKGTGRSYGYDGISEIGRTLEEAAKSRDDNEVRRQADALAAYLQRVKLSR